MAIGKKPNRQPTATAEERAASQFIAGASKPKAKLHKIPTTLRFDPELLARIDAAARRRKVSRSAWIQYTLSRVLDEESE
jgi:predicted HicB family RNase H-like nuclease